MNLDPCIALIVDRRWLNILLSFLVMLALAAGARHPVLVDVDVRNHFRKDDPHIVALQQLEDTYALSDAALVAVALQKDILIPNVVPAAMAIGLLGYAVGEVGVAASVVTAIAFGIIVDDTIHFMTKYVGARKSGLLPSESVQSAFRSVGKALLATTVVFGLGFMVFGASGMVTNQALGLLVGMTVIIALLADFLFLPPLLMALDGTRETSQEIRERLSRSIE